MAAHAQSDINTQYPISVFRYMAKIGDADIFFSEISGLSLEYESTEYKEAGMVGGKGKVVTMQVIGQRITPSLTMKRGLLKGDLDLYNWFNQTHTDDFKKKDIVISLLDNNGAAIMTWTVSNAFCTKFEGPSLDATSNEVAFQTIELKGDGIEVKAA